MINPNYSSDYFEVGDTVFYVPSNAISDFKSWIGGGEYEKDSFFDPKMSFFKFEEGIVSSKNDSKNVFVKYFRKGELSSMGQSTNPQDLVLWKKAKI